MPAFLPLDGLVADFTTLKAKIILKDMKCSKGEKVTGTYKARDGTLNITNKRVVLEGSGDGIVISLDDLHSFMASGNGEIRLVWGEQKQMEKIRVDSAVSVETAIREAVRSCGRQIA